MIGLYHYIALGLFAGFAALELVAEGRRLSRRRALAAARARLHLALFRARDLRALVLGRLARPAPPVRRRHLPLWAQILGGFLALRARRLCLAPDDAQHAVPVALVPPDAPQRRAARHLGRALFPPVRHARLHLRRQPGAGARFRGQRGGRDRRSTSSRPFSACSSTSTSAPRAGSATSSSAPKATAPTTSAASTPAIIPTCPCGT